MEIEKLRILNISDSCMLSQAVWLLGVIIKIYRIIITKLVNHDGGVDNVFC